ncbi:hypothetical protein GALL_151490 [mine drainage metagenome]|uniref:Uncharacterized protein n=1 Tax=mine drainage metagenome TaxID=410659 RepID=A0A1J5S2S0_9ZZZZ
MGLARFTGPEQGFRGAGVDGRIDPPVVKRPSGPGVCKPLLELGGYAATCSRSRG